MLTHHQASCIGPGCAAGVRLQPRCTPVPQAPMLVNNVVAAPTQQPAQLAGRSRGIGIGSLSVVCMAHPRRVAKVSSAIQRELSQLFLYDKVLSQAICPDRRLGGDEISAVASITDVYVSNDLQVVKVYVSIYSDSQGKKTAMENLKRLEPYVRRVMAQRMVLRLTPEYRFEYDDSIEEADLVARVLGDEEIARFTRELDEEYAAAAQKSRGLDSTATWGWADDASQQLPAAGGSEASAATVEAGADEGEQGFFDQAPLPASSSASPAVDAEERAAAAAAEKERRAAAVAKRRAQATRRLTSSGFVVGPFDDLFGPLEDDDQLVGVRRKRWEAGSQSAGRRTSQQGEQASQPKQAPRR